MAVGLKPHSRSSAFELISATRAGCWLARMQRRVQTPTVNFPLPVLRVANILRWIGVSFPLLWGKTLTIYVLIWLWLRWTRITVTVQPFDQREEQQLSTSLHWNACIPASTGGFLFSSAASERQPSSEFALSLAVMQEFHPDLTVLKDQCISSRYAHSSVNPKEMRGASAKINTKWLKSYFFLP